MSGGQNRNITAAGRSAWIWAATLAPASALLPSIAAGAGRGGWVIPLLALPGVWLIQRLQERVTRGGCGLGEVFCCLLGTRLGRALTTIYIMWAPVLGGWQLHRSIQRIKMALDGVRSPLLMAVMVLLATWFARSGPEVCARWAEPVLKWLLGMLGAVVVLALMQIDWESLVPLWQFEGGLLPSIGTTVGVLCVGVYGAFFKGEAVGKRNEGICYLPVMCAVFSALLATVQGNLGVELAARLEDPLLTLTRNIGITGAFQRAESLVATLLLLADLALLSLLVWSVRCAAQQVWPDKKTGWTGVGAAAGVVIVAQVAGGLDLVLRRAIPGGNVLLGIGGPALAAVASCLRKRKDRGTSCA